MTAYTIRDVRTNDRGYVTVTVVDAHGVLQKVTVPPMSADGPLLHEAIRAALDARRPPAKPQTGG